MEHRDIDLTGSVGPVYFRPGDTFHGIELAELVKRLRIDPEASPVEFLEGVTVYLDEDEVFLPDGDTVDPIESLMGVTPQDCALASADNADFVWSMASLKGGWLIDLFAEVRHVATWVGEVTNPRMLALKWIGDRIDEWYIDTQREFNVRSPHLDPLMPEDVEMLRSVADLGVRVTLNSVEIAPTSR